MKLTIKQAEMIKDLDVGHGENLLKILQAHGYNVNAYCGGQGVCGKCKVLIKGSLELTANEEKILTNKEKDAGVRLACEHTVTHDMEIEVEDNSEISVLTESKVTQINLDPIISKKLLNLDKPTLDDQRDYWSRIMAKTDAQFPTLSGLQLLASWDQQSPVTLTIYNKQVLNIEPTDTSEFLYGIAIDIGTTTIAVYLLDLISGNELDVYSFYNPQKKFGADVVARVNYTLNNKNGLYEVRDTLINGLNQAITALLNNNDINAKNVSGITIVGNTIMLHSLLGINAAAITSSPYTPVFTHEIKTQAQDIGLNVNPAGMVYLLPSISGYVGADVIADMLAAGIDNTGDNYNLLIDIGTNGEIVLANNDKIWACSTAAGPAFEGANITCGMAGVQGAINKFNLEDHGFQYQTIGNKSPKGICGSGLVDIVGELVKCNLLESTGAFIEDSQMENWQQDLMTDYNGMKAFHVAGDDILLTQKDVREMQLAKGAIAAGINILLKEAGITYDEIDNMFLAGGFGNYIDPANAGIIGLIPSQLVDKVVQIGNGAGLGAKMYLLDKKLKQKAIELQRKTNYIELSSRLDFQTEFVDAMMF